MLNPKLYTDIISGKKRGLLASAARASLALAQYPYAAGVYVRNRRFDTAHQRIHRVQAPVISVGNITLGGTGKTPCIAYLAKWLLAAGHRPAIVSRGYGAKDGRPNDEALELQQFLPDVPHQQNPDRVAAANRVIQKYACDVILLDDGFQHRRLHRDLDIVLLDATQPFGFDQIFPRGTLREPVSSLRRADIVMVTRCDAVSQDQLETIRQRVLGTAPDVQWVTANHAPQLLQNTQGDTLPLERLQDWRVAGFCGIGNPASFRHELQARSGRMVGFREFPDHFDFAQDQRDLLRWAHGLPLHDAVVCTAKDLVKFDAPVLAEKPLWAMQVALDVVSGLSALERCLADCL